MLSDKKCISWLKCWITDLLFNNRYIHFFKIYSTLLNTTAHVHVQGHFINTRNNTLLNWAQDTGVLLKSSEISGLSKIFWARQCKLHLSNACVVCTSDMNLQLRASDIWLQGTRSGTTNGILFCGYDDTKTLFIYTSYTAALFNSWVWILNQKLLIHFQ